MAGLCKDCSRVISDTRLDTLLRFEQVASCKNTCDPESQLKELEVEISRYSERLNTLHRYRCRMKKKINTTLSLFAKLPLEIWAEIFRSCFTPFENAEYVNKDRDLPTPLSLGKVCSVWRDVAWSTPVLWSSVCVIIHNITVQATLLDEWLARSGSCPLSICLTSSDDNYGDEPLSDIIDAIKPYSSRWRVIDFLLPRGSFRELTSVRPNLPLLTSLTLRIDAPNADEHRVIPRSITAFSLAPQLRDVYMHCPFSPFMVVLPWHQLTRFRGDTFYPYECIEVLSQTLNLEECIFDDIVDDSESHPFPATPMSLRQLSSLSLIARNHDTSCMQLFDLISEIALCHLQLCDCDRNFPMDQLIRLLSRSSCKLQRLDVRDTSIADYQLIRCFRPASSLVELRLNMNSIIRNSAEIPSPASPVVFPSLKALSITCRHESDISRVLDFLTLPAAKEIHFSVKCTTDAHAFPHSHFLALLLRSSCALRSLSLERMNITERELSQYLQCLPSLVELKLSNITPRDNGYILNEIVRMLQRSLTAKGEGLPNLEVLEFLGVSYFDPESLESVLSSRWRQNGRDGVTKLNGRPSGVSKIRSVRIVMQNGMTIGEEIMRRLHELKDEGMMIKVSN